MTAIDWTSPTEVLEEARRRNARRDAGLPLAPDVSDNRVPFEGVADESEEGTWQQEESACRALFEKAGCEVFSTSERRRAKRSPGVPDLIVFGPPGSPFHLYFEVKHGQGKLSEPQRRFELHCQRTTTRHAAGSAATARRTLKTLIAEYSAPEKP